MLLLAAVWALPMWWASGPSDTRDVEEGVRAHHAEARALPFADFVVDRSNQLSGRALGADGSPLAGVTVQIHATEALREATRGLAPGRWPDVEPEAVTRTDEDGRYHVAELTYGSKVATFLRDGLRPHALHGITHCDGYASHDQDAVLEAAEARAFRFVTSDPRDAVALEAAAGPEEVAGAAPPGSDPGALGAVLAGEAVHTAPATPVEEPLGALPVLWVPRHFGPRPVATATDAEGWATPPAHLWSSAGPPRCFVGDPPSPVALPPEDSDSTVRIAPAADLEIALEIALEGPLDGDASVSLFPAGLRRLGARTRTLEVRGGRVVLPSVLPGEYEVWVERAGRAAWARIRHPAEAPELQLLETVTLDLHVRVGDAPATAGRVRWQPGDEFAIDALGPDPLVWSEQEHPLERTAAIDGAGAATLALPGGLHGRLRIVVPGAPPFELDVKSTALELEPGATNGRIEVVLPVGLPYRLRTYRPYQPTVVEASNGVRQAGWSDAFAEFRFDAPAGPLVARTALDGGIPSWPLGHWIAEPEGLLRFGRVDAVGRGGAVCFHGFVLDHEGRPVEHAEVFAQAWDGRPRLAETDEHGYYRFPGLPAGSYALLARAKEDYRAVRELKSFTVPPGTVDTWRRWDFTLWPGSVAVRTSEPVRLWDAEGTLLATSTLPPEDGVRRFTNLAPGAYRITSVDDAETEWGRAEVTHEVDRLVWIDPLATPAVAPEPVQ